MGSLLGLLHTEGKTIDHSPIPAESLAGLLKLVDDEVISGKMAKTVFEEMAATGKSPAAIVAEKGLSQVSDSGALEEEIDAILSAQPDEAARYREGQKKLMGFFVGQVMKATRGKANPKVVNALLRKKLDG